jgi:segregation and condensation protein A
MLSSSAQEAIAILIDMAQSGEIDPWDVQVIDVIDRFLAELGIANSLEDCYEYSHLPRSGQAFLWASMLVRFKADTLELVAEEPEEQELPLEAELIADNELDSLSPAVLEKQIRRRTAAPPPRKRRVTLQELITQIEEIATEFEKVAVKRPKKNTSRSYTRKEALNTITQLAHQENLTELAGQLETFFREQIVQTLKDQEWLELENLLQVWHQLHTPLKEDQSPDKVGIFGALLLLSSQSKVSLSQDEFYQDLKVKFLN